LGSKAYKTGKIGSRWLVGPVPAIYESDELRGYIEWFDPDETEAKFSIDGSFVSSDITDYHMTQMERGQGHPVDLNHDFVGRDALAKRIDDAQRERVTYVWHDEDIVSLFASLFCDGPTSKFLNLPDTCPVLDLADCSLKGYYTKISSS